MNDELATIEEIEIESLDSLLAIGFDPSDNGTNDPLEILIQLEEESVVYPYFA